MNTKSLSRFNSRIISTWSVLVSCLLLWGCPTKEAASPVVESKVGKHESSSFRFPAVVVNMPKVEGGKAVVPVSLETIGKSDSELWTQVNQIMDGADFWRVCIWKFADGKLIESQNNCEWKRVKEQGNEHAIKEITLTLPAETLLQGWISACHQCKSQKDDDVGEIKTVNPVNFLVHRYPET